VGRGWQGGRPQVLIRITVMGFQVRKNRVQISALPVLACTFLLLVFLSQEGEIMFPDLVPNGRKKHLTTEYDTQWGLRNTSSLSFLLNT
jgi:hypothetical protein